MKKQDEELRWELVDGNKATLAIPDLHDHAPLLSLLLVHLVVNGRVHGGLERWGRDRLGRRL